MIVSYKHQFVYLGPPRTASTTLHAWLAQPHLDATISCSSEQHSAAIPPDALDFFTFASVREPLDRAVSLWRHYCENPHDRAGFPDLDFPTFVRRVHELPWLYRVSQAAILAGVRLDAFVRFHRLEEDLRKIPCLGHYWEALQPLPQLNPSHYRPPVNRIYTAELETQVKAYWQDDLTLWTRVQAEAISKYRDNCIDSARPPRGK